MAHTQLEALRDLAERTAGMRYDSAEAQAAHGAADWTDYYPEVDGYGTLTGRVIDANEDGYIVVDDVAMVEARTLSAQDCRLINAGWFPVWVE